MVSARALFALAVILAGVVAFTGTAALTASLAACGLVASVTAAVVAWRLRSHPALSPTPPPARGLRGLSIVAVVAVAIQLVRLSVFVVDADRPAWSATPWNAWVTGHSCVSAYWAAAREALTIDDLYGDALSIGPPATPGGRPTYKKLGPLYVDPYEYPPTFLLLPRALRLLAPDFFDFRQLWFALNLAVVALGLVAIARRLEGALGPGPLWLAPVVLAPLAIMTTLQVGNVQLACVALSLLAMLLLEDRTPSSAGRLALGGLFLAFATVSKLYPAMLVVYLLARQRWKAVAWTAVWGVALGLLGLLDLGLAPHEAFLRQLPKLLSGEAFPALANPRGVSGNMSVPGLVFKLGVVYGVPHMSYDAARLVGTVYTVIVAALAVALARRPLPTAWEPLAWLAILILATLRSPLLPPYGAFPPLWLATVVLAASWTRPRARLLALLATAVFFPVTPSQTLLPPALHAVVTSLQTVTALALVAWTLRLRERREPAIMP